MNGLDRALSGLDHALNGVRVVGLDLSLSSTGVSDGWSVHAFQTTDEHSVEDRINCLVDTCTSFVMKPTHGDAPFRRADLVVIEGAAFGSKGNAVDQLAGLRWAVRCELSRLNQPFAIVPPSTLKAYTAGNGRAGKPEMVAALAARHGLDLRAHKVKDGKYDMADAYALAAMGYARLGRPLRTEGPPPPLASLLVVNWPDVGTS